MLGMVLRRWRTNEATLRQSEKMAQLGTFTAGIAHELNNPAAAVQRSTGQLESMIDQFGQAQVQIDHLNLTEAQQAIRHQLDEQLRERAARPPVLDVLVRSDREGELEAWLDEREMVDAWDIAPTLVDMGYDVADLERLADNYLTDQLPAVIGWLNATYTTYNLLVEIGQGAGRISEIVKALKSYAYLDQAPVQMVEVHEGLDQTLLILRHKLKTGISVQRDYAPDLPKFQAYGNELNQVWTNIIDNAIDAVGEQGKIIIRTRREGDRVVVEIEDNGPGISSGVQAKIFDPFFTTKPPGQGTGLGLDISYNIVVRRHQGDIKVFSQPGQTCFKVWLPLDLDTR
jgi:signal transduction histidine kinase